MSTVHATVALPTCTPHMILHGVQLSARHFEGRRRKLGRCFRTSYLCHFTGPGALYAMYDTQQAIFAYYDKAGKVRVATAMLPAAARAHRRRARRLTLCCYIPSRYQRLMSNGMMGQRSSK